MKYFFRAGFFPMFDLLLLEWINDLTTAPQGRCDFSIPREWNIDALGWKNIHSRAARIFGLWCCCLCASFYRNNLLPIAVTQFLLKTSYFTHGLG